MPTKIVKFTANSTFYKLNDGESCTLYLSPETGVSALTITDSGTAPSSDYANTFYMKSGVMDGTLTIQIDTGSYAYIKAVTETSVVSAIVTSITPA